MRISGMRMIWGLGLAVMICRAMAGPKNTELQVDGLELHNVKAEAVEYSGRDAVKVTYAGSDGLSDAERFAVVRGLHMKDGVVEVHLTGNTTKDASPTARGLWGWHSEFQTASRILSVFICDRTMAEQKTNC